MQLTQLTLLEYLETEKQLKSCEEKVEFVWKMHEEHLCSQDSKNLNNALEYYYRRYFPNDKIGRGSIDRSFRKLVYTKKRIMLPAHILNSRIAFSEAMRTYYGKEGIL